MASLRAGSVDKVVVCLVDEDHAHDIQVKLPSLRQDRHWGIRVDDQLAGGVELRVREDGQADLSYLVFFLNGLTSPNDALRRAGPLGYTTSSSPRVA